MGSTPFPSALYPRILADSYQAEPVFSVTVQQASDLSELRLLHGDAWRCSFKMVTRNASERTVFRDFYAARSGNWDSFPFISRDDLVLRQVRFEEVVGVRVKDSLAAWEYQITLVEVVA